MKFNCFILIAKVARLKYDQMRELMTLVGATFFITFNEDIMIENNTIYIEIDELNNDLSKVLLLAEKYDRVIICKDGLCKYEFSQISGDVRELTDDERIDIVARRVLKKYHKAFEVLAQ